MGTFGITSHLNRLETYIFSTPVPLEKAKPPTLAGVYVLYLKAADNRPLVVRYIGQTSNLNDRATINRLGYQRLLSEAEGRPERIYFACHVATPDAQDRFHIEKALIQVYKPLYNTTEESSLSAMLQALERFHTEK